MKKACACLWHQRESVKPGKQESEVSNNEFLNNLYIAVLIDNNWHFLENSPQLRTFDIKKFFEEF